MFCSPVLVSGVASAGASAVGLLFIHMATPAIMRTAIAGVMSLIAVF